MAGSYDAFVGARAIDAFVGTRMIDAFVGAFATDAFIGTRAAKLRQPMEELPMAATRASRLSGGARSAGCLRSQPWAAPTEARRDNTQRQPRCHGHAAHVTAAHRRTPVGARHAGDGTAK